MIADTRRVSCASQGREVIYDAEHFFDGCEANPEYALQTLQAAARRRRDARHPVRHQRRHAARGDRRASTRRRKPSCRVPVGIHCHNDCDLAVANSLAAVDAGRRPGAGHDQRHRRALRQRRPDQRHRQPGASRSGLSTCSTAGSVTHLTELSRFVYETANMNFRPSQPFVGQSAFAHKGGMHVHADRPGHRAATSTSTRPRSATSGAFWSASCPAGRTSPP